MPLSKSISQMPQQGFSAAAQGRLEHPCDVNWMHCRDLAPGLTHIRCGLGRDAFSRHSHDTYTVVVTTSGRQRFFYRGGTSESAPGEVVILHPGELHDGMPGVGGRFSYSGFHVAPGLVTEALGLHHSGSRGLPFVPEPVLSHPRLACLLATDADTLEPLRTHEVVTVIATELHALAGLRLRRQFSDGHAMGAVSEFLRANATRVVALAELEAIGGVSMFELSRQFKQYHGVSPYRYLMLRRTEIARRSIVAGRTLADAAADAGFSDQAHMTRSFRAFIGVTPGRYRSIASR